MNVGSIHHLTLDAIVAFSDGEMSMVSFQRAAAHVARCPQCDAEVRAQLAARSCLRSAQTPAMPTSLLDTLRSIPVALPASPTDGQPSQGYPRTGELGRPATPDQRAAHRGRRFRFLGASALVAGLTVGVLVGAEHAADPDGHPDSPQVAHVSPVAVPQVITAGWGNP